MASYKKKRQYKMVARAEAANHTKSKIVDAATACFTSMPYELVTLKTIAQEANVALQTVVRVGGSKEKIFLSAAEKLMGGLMLAMQDLPQNDGSAALRFLVDYYEEWGDRAMRLMAAEDRIPTIKTFLQQNRLLQQMWIDRLYDESLSKLSVDDRRKAVISLMTITGVHAWHVLRRVHALSIEDTFDTVHKMAMALIKSL
jgi:AcrR family transcriptional regulator